MPLIIIFVITLASDTAVTLGNTGDLHSTYINANFIKVRANHSYKSTIKFCNYISL